MNKSRLFHTLLWLPCAIAYPILYLIMTLVVVVYLFVIRNGRSLSG